jgi:hypothetical protein
MRKLLQLLYVRQIYAKISLTPSPNMSSKETSHDETMNSRPTHASEVPIWLWSFTDEYFALWPIVNL